VLLCSVAHADDPRAEAQKHYQVGRVAFGKGQFREALAEFQKAYESAPIPDLLYNIGRCQEELGDPGAAAKSYERYLAAKPDAHERDELLVHIDELKKAPARPEAPPAAVVVAPAPPPARVPVYRRWWLWTSIGAAVAVGVGVGLGVGLSSSSPAPLSFPGVVAR
jgi:tetratricopeptide (TPR) repeat protein